MELYITSAVIGLGYYLSKSDKNNESPVAPIPDKSVPNGDNIFDSNRVQDIRLQEQAISDSRYNQALNNSDSNLIIPGPPEAYFNKVDYADNTLPIEFNSNPSLDNGTLGTSPMASKKHYGMAHNPQDPVAGGHYGISLTGEPIDPQNFAHNNMVPFFKGAIRQNVDEVQNQSLLETFSGNMKYERKKDEIPNLFDPQANIGLPYGSPALTLAYGKERFIASNIRNNESPTEKIYVGPGLNKGYTAQPSGGFQQANTRDYTLPKTVDELRVKTNPKVTYYLPVRAGSNPNFGSPKIGVVQKNRPDTFAVWTPDRYFITTGDRIKPKQRPEVVLKHSNRATTDIRKAMGPAGPNDLTRESLRPHIKVSEKCQYTPGGPRNADGTGKWTIPECEEPMENYVPMEKCSPNNFPTTNVLTQPRHKQDPYKDHRNHMRKPHDYGRGGFSMVSNNRETTACLPAINLEATDRGYYVPINPNLRPSRKQNVVGNARWAGNVQGPHNRHPVWDPNDVPKTTVKETTLSSGILGIAQPMNMKHKVFDPTDVPKTTHKETTHTDYAGDAYMPNESGRESNCYTMKNTNKQFTSVNEHYGNATGEEEGAYQIRHVNPRETNRQYTSVVEYSGNANSAVPKPRESSCMMENATTRSYREVLSRGRTPGRQGPKGKVDPSMINATTKRAGDLYNMALAQRPRMSTKVYNSLPQANRCAETKDKKTLPNKPIRDRLDSRILDAFRSNPYTQSLSSYVF